MEKTKKLQIDSTMKNNLLRIIMMALLLHLSHDGICQNYYRCTSDSLAVRVSPGSASDIFYIATPYYNCQVGDVYITKGFVFMSRDVTENGYIKIYNLYNTICWDEGWIELNSYVRAQKCKSCRGRGITNRRCKKCDGFGDWECCQYKGYEICATCQGIGYI